MKQSQYTLNYSTLRRLVEENNFILFLNNLKLQEYIKPYLLNITNDLYAVITSDNLTKIESEAISNDDRINKLLQEVLSGNKLYASIKENDISNKLFTDALLKLRKRLFEKDGLNNEKYIIQSYIHYWLEDNLAKIISNDYRFSSLQIIKKLLVQSEILHHFYTSFKNALPVEWINKEQENWIKSADDYSLILDRIHTFDNDYFKGYKLLLNELQNKSPWEYVIESTRFSDYAIFDDEYSFRNIVLFSKDKNLWLKFWDNLSLPIIQNVVFIYFDSPFEFLPIVKTLNNQKNNISSSPKHLALILLNNLFACVKKTQENLSFYVNEERNKNLSIYERDEELLNSGKTLYEKWSEERKNIYPEIFKNVSTILSYDEISEWVYSYVPREINSTNNYNKLYNEEIEILVNAFNTHFSDISIEDRINSLYLNFNLPNFNALIHHSENLNLNSEQACDLLNKLALFISSDKFYWNNTFSEMYWKGMKGIGILLSLCKNPETIAYELLDQFKVCREGWKVSDSDYKLTQHESYILCGVMLLLEHKKCFKNQKEKKVLFEFILKRTISQVRFATYNVNNDYISTLYLLGLLVMQIFPSFKKNYESELINGVDDLVVLLKILTNADYEISEKGKKNLIDRIESEMPYIRQQLLQKDQTSEIESIETMVTVLRSNEGKKK